MLPQPVDAVEKKQLQLLQERNVKATQSEVGLCFFVTICANHLPVSLPEEETEAWR